MIGAGCSTMTGLTTVGVDVASVMPVAVDAPPPFEVADVFP